MRQLSLGQLAQGRLAALQNAVDLIKDAECLLGKGRWARSVFLSHIAIEELGKYLIIMGTIVNLIVGRTDWKKFWKRFVSHGEKARNIFYFDAILSNSQEAKEVMKYFQKADTDTKKSQSEKLSSLYVDFRGDKFVQPMDIINEDAAEKELENAKAVLSFLRRGEDEVFSKVDFCNLSSDTLSRIKDEINTISNKLKKA